MARLGNRLVMDAMDLSNQPPRTPRAELGGVIFLGRSVDKARAHQPGGDPGPYVLSGLTGIMLETLGISLDAFRAAVASAASDDDVAAYVHAHTTPEKVAEWNAWASARQPRDGDRAAARETYPWLDERPDLLLSIDILVEDDARYFADKRRGARAE